MKLPEHELEAHREAFRAMSIPQKAEYIFAYYKLPLVLILIAVIALGSVAKYFITHKNAVLYAAYANVALTDEQDAELFDGFLASTGTNMRKNEVYRYRDLYLAEVDDTVDHQYSYASRIKTLAAIDAEELDVVLMNKAAYDLLSNSGYLMDLEKVISDNPSLLPVRADLEQNVVVLEDNRVEVELNEADTYEAVTENVFNALDVTDVLTSKNDLTGTVYLGIIGNSPRLDTVVSFITYLYSL